MADYGFAPYEEAAAKAQVRMSTGQRIAQLIAGAAQGLQSSNSLASPFEAGILGFGGAYGAAQKSRQAAHEYAMKMIDAQQARELRTVQEKHLEALTARTSKEPPVVETHAKPPWYLRPEWINTPEGKAAAAKATHISTKTSKPAATPKPRAAVMGRIDLINSADVNNPEHRARLESVIRNPSTQEEKDAALRKLMSHITIRPR